MKGRKERGYKVELVAQHLHDDGACNTERPATAEDLIHALWDDEGDLQEEFLEHWRRSYYRRHPDGRPGVPECPLYSIMAGKPTQCRGPKCGLWKIESYPEYYQYEDGRVEYLTPVGGHCCVGYGNDNRFHFEPEPYNRPWAPRRTE